MDSERWTKICWEEIKRGAKNEMATEWGREMERRSGTWRGVVDGNEEGDMIKKMEELLRTDNTEGLGKDRQLDILPLV